MEVRQLRYFEAVVRHRHFTRAAEELHVAQSALSHQVRRLERELGVELLTRTTRTVTPTEAGELVAARARTAMAELEALRGEVDELRGLVRGHVSVGALLFGGELDIPRTLARFSSTFPEVELGLREGTARRMIEMLANGTIDVAFALELEPPEGLERIELSSEELALAMRPGHPFAGEGALAVAALRDSRLIVFERGASTRQLADTALADAEIQPRVALEANDLALVRSLVAEGLGLAILPRSFLERPGPSVVIRALRPELRMKVVLWWRSDRRLSPAAQAFVEFTAASASLSDKFQGTSPQ
jgi:LysR family transcriptional regulator, transcription activator of glutamate synthase operon